MKIPLAELSKAFRTSEENRYWLLEFYQEQATLVGQIAGCNRLHESEERLERWLLMVQDRAQSEVLYFTQEFLGMMVGSPHNGHRYCLDAATRRTDRIFQRPDENH